MPSTPEAWLRGPIAGVPPALMPAAHALVQAFEDLERSTADLTPAETWTRPSGAASVGFHLMHFAGSLDRLYTYARGDTLSDAQRAALAAEREPIDPRPERDALIADARRMVDRALDQLRATDPATLEDPRPVGRAALPSTVAGLLFHGAEHAARHAGQVVTTARIVRGQPAR